MLSFSTSDLIPFNVTGCLSCTSSVSLRVLLVSLPGVNVIVINRFGKSGGEELPYKSIVL